MKFDFVHLRTQSSYSFLASTLTIDRIVELTKAQKMPAICLADQGNLFGSLEFALNCAKAGIQPIHGAILNIAYQKSDHKQDFAEILLIAKDEIGYKNLLQLVSNSFIKNERQTCNHISFADLTQHNSGLIALSCYTDGLIGQNLLAKDTDLAISLARQLQNIFANRFYCEIMRHNIPIEQLIEASYLKIASDLNIPLVATNKVLFSDVNMHDAHDTLLCIAAGVTKEYEDRKTVSTNCYFKSSQEMMELFRDLPQSIENTINLAQRCYVMAEANPPMLPNFASDDISETTLIKKDAEQGLVARLATKFKLENITVSQQENIKQQYLDRLNYELNVICNMGFAGYFLIVADFIKWSKEQGILVGPGRGSGAGSIVAWSLLITDLDPIKFGLLFERFLNPERISMPDFDIDFCQERREEVINYVRTKYGDNRVGQIITFGKLQAKAVIKDVSRVLGLPYKYADYLTELVPFNAINPVTLKQAIKEVAELSDAACGKGLYNLDGQFELIKQVLDSALILEGLHRHASTHAAGIVIAAKDLVEIVPVYKDTNSDMLVVQYSMKYAEIAGLIKFDFLGLQTLTVITKCIELLKQQKINIDFSNILFDDNKTYQMLCTGAGTGIFQFESVGMKDTLKRLKPDSIQDLIALGALYRPGPMENIQTYIACKHGLQQPDYLHDLLKPILAETYGVIIYQEQVLEIAKVLANYSLASADILRRAMGKKIKSEMAQQEEIFIKGAIANNIPPHQAKSIFATVAKFAGYGFNKSHASAYAVISYQTAYLKANFPAEFLVACLNLELNNHDKINLFIQEAKNNDISIIAPNINVSTGYFTISSADKKFIIYALAAIKAVTINFSKILVEERIKHGVFKNIIDFMERLYPKFINRKLLENLVKAGCFDRLHANRNQLLLSIPKLLAYATSYHAEKISNQFSLIKVNEANRRVLIDAELLEDNILAFYEFEVLGLFMTIHPISKYQNLLEQFSIMTSINLQNDLPHGASQIKVAGIIEKKDSRMSARGRFVTLKLSDQFGIFELTIFSEEVLKNYVHLLDVKSLVIAHCDLFKDEGGIRLTAKSFSTIDDMINENKLELKLYPQNHLELCQIVDLLKGRINLECSNRPLAKLTSSKEFEGDSECQTVSYDSSSTDYPRTESTYKSQAEVERRKGSNVKISLLLKVDKNSNFVAKINLPECFYLDNQDFELLQKLS